MTCKHCGNEVVLIPSAAERAKKFGGKAIDFTKLFPIHADCQIEMRKVNPKNSEK